MIEIHLDQRPPSLILHVRVVHVVQQKTHIVRISSDISSFSSSFSPSLSPSSHLCYVVRQHAIEDAASKIKLPPAQLVHVSVLFTFPAVCYSVFLCTCTNMSLAVLLPVATVLACNCKPLRSHGQDVQIAVDLCLVYGRDNAVKRTFVTSLSLPCISTEKMISTLVLSLYT